MSLSALSRRAVRRLGYYFHFLHLKSPPVLLPLHLFHNCTFLCKHLSCTSSVADSQDVWWALTTSDVQCACDTNLIWPKHFKDTCVATANLPEQLDKFFQNTASSSNLLCCPDRSFFCVSTFIYICRILVNVGELTSGFSRYLTYDLLCSSLKRYNNVKLSDCLIKWSRGFCKICSKARLHWPCPAAGGLQQ